MRFCKKMAGCSAAAFLSLATVFAGMPQGAAYQPEQWDVQQVVVTPEKRYAYANAGVHASLEDGSGKQFARAEAIEPAGAQPSAADSEWANRVLANVEECLNIRREPSTESELAGKLYQGGVGELLEKGEAWSKITSGSVEGYVSNEFLYFGEDAKAAAEKDGIYIAKVTTDTLNVRKEPSADAAVTGLVGAGETLKVVERDENSAWIGVSFEGNTAYIAKEFAEVSLDLKEAISIEEEIAALEAQKAEEARKAAAAAKAASAQTARPSVTQNQAVSASYDETTLLAALIYCEAGAESYEGKLAVGSVVMNRVRSGVYPGSITAVIYQPGQFPPATNGRMDQVLAGGLYQGECMNAALEALSGVSNVGGAIGFTTPGSGRSGYVIGNQLFF